jgi:sarcosine oxidase subunit alpha
MRIGFTGELSYEIHVPSGYARHVWNALIEAGAEFGISPFGVEAQRVLRLEKAHIIVSQDTDAVTDPFSADLGWMVKLTKPDFLGKRSLARIAKEGPKQRLVGFKMTRPTVVPQEGLQVVRRTKNRKQESIGHITSSRFSPTLKETIGLCWLPAEMAQENTPFTIRMNGTLEEARVHHGAFYDAKGERLRM